ncbi:MAG: 2,3-bisphosphoglycerate-independent phosphoglycerate mutase [Christensenellales bacterium]|jgi:2,3-bisphosphoglycerate-independent phosphoglycerate mutase
MKGKNNLLMILDGFGYNPEKEGNAIANAKKPNIDALWKEYPHTLIQASGLAVGLPRGQMGNSEVGHTNLGAGRIVYQALTRITLFIEDGSFFQNEALLWAMKEASEKGTALHCMGLCSDGGVHSHLEHLYALVEMAKRNNIKKVYIHCFMDGRDVPPSSGIDFIRQLEKKLAEIGIGEIATVTGRYYAMDRDKRWERVEKAYDAIACGNGNMAFSAVEAMENSYASGVTDEFVAPTVIVKDGKPLTMVQEGDSIVFFNFRPDRAREITRAFIEKDFIDFPRRNGYVPVQYVTFTQYDATFTNLKVAFTAKLLGEELDNVLGVWLAKKGKTQLRIAETEKYAHVTFFFNGGVEIPNAGEDRCLIPSPKVATYDLQPGMSANEVAESVIERIHSNKYDYIILNFANPDMVGHTGVMQAAIEAIEIIDRCVGRVIEAILQEDGRAILTADHGNADLMVDPVENIPYTAHSTNLVPLIIIDPALKDYSLRRDGVLADVAPTLLDMTGLEQPEEMTGKTLLIHN